MCAALWCGVSRGCGNDLQTRGNVSSFLDGILVNTKCMTLLTCGCCSCARRWDNMYVDAWSLLGKSPVYVGLVCGGQSGLVWGGYD